MAQASGLAVTDDGTNVYVATFSGSVAALARDPASGVLRQLSGRAGCVGLGRCRRARGLGGGYDIALDPSQRYVYVSGGSGIAAFSRQEDGSLRQLPGPSGCLSYEGAGQGCGLVDRPRGDTSITISPDGRHAYVTDLYANAVVVYDRDPGTGALLPAAGSDRCHDSQGGFPAPPTSCRPARGLGGARDSAVSADGRHLYVAGGASVAVFDRDASTGRLSQLAGPAGCVSSPGYLGSLAEEDCSQARGVTGYSLTIGEPGGNAYFSSGWEVTGFSRRGDGSLEQIAVGGCLTGRRPAMDCVGGTGLGGQTGAIDTAPGGRIVYAVTSSFTSGGDDEGRAALTAYARDPLTGSLRQLAASPGCLSQGFEVGCGRARGIADATDVAVSPDTRHVYVTGHASGAVAAFAICRPELSPCQKLHVTNRGGPSLDLRGVPSGCVPPRFAVRATVTAPNGVRALGLRLGGRRIGRTTRGGSLREVISAAPLSTGRHELVATARDGAGLRVRRRVPIRRCPHEPA